MIIPHQWTQIWSLALAVVGEIFVNLRGTTMQGPISFNVV